MAGTANRTITGLLAKRATTGRNFVKLPQQPCLTILYVDISGGTASVDIEVSEDPTKPDPLKFFPIKTVTVKSVHRISMPSSVIAVNVTAISGATVEVRYRILVLDNAPEYAIDTFQEGDITARKIVVAGDVSVDLTASNGAATRFYGPAQPGTANSTLYTVPALKIALIKAIHIANTTALAATVTLSINGSTDATMWLKAFSIPANSTYDWTGELALAATNTIQGLQGTSGACTVVISGDLRDA